MTNDDVLREFREAGALWEGHFVPSSGLHSAIFLQKNLVFMYPARCERLCRAPARAITAGVGQVDVCVSPAVGSIIPGHETARHLGAPVCPADSLPAARAAIPEGDPVNWRLSA